MTTEHATPEPPPDRPSKGWFTRLILDPLSSVKLGIALLIILFIYCSVGSAGIFYPTGLNVFTGWHQQMPRQWRIFEMTEYEWFHAPFFLALCALITLNIITTTLRRIPFKVVNYGVWTIHTGILILMVGSVIYFGSKVEGDTPVFRRLIRITSNAGATLSLPALPDRAGRIFTPEGPYTFTVAQIDPNWPILSGDHQGERAYSVTLKVEAPDRTFMRQVLDGYPEFTEDVIPGKGRAIKLPEFGTKITDDSFSVALDYFPQTQFWTRESSALAVRRVGPDGTRGPWMEVPIPHLPRYNDYVATPDVVWSAPATLRAHPIDIPVVARADDNPLKNKFAHVTAYLRYATLETRVIPGGDGGGGGGGGGPINPVLSLTMHTPMAGDVQQSLAALDPDQSSALGGMVAFKYAPDAAGMQKLADMATSRIVLEVPASDGAAPARLELDINAVDFDRSIFRPVGDSGWKVRLADVVRNLAIDTDHTVSLAIVEVQTPDAQRFTRWVFDEPSLTRDLPFDASGGVNHTGANPREPDPRLTATFDAGFSTPLVIIGGPQSVGLRALTLMPDGAYTARDVAPGERFPLGAAGITIASYSERATRVQKPVIVPLEQRDRDADRSRWFSLVQVQIETPQGMQRIWLPFHQFALEDQSLAARGLGRYDPTTVMLADGSIIDVIFTRQSMPLANAVALDDFRLTTHVGGYSGDVSSIRDWTSQLRFWNDKTQQWSKPLSVASNQPAEYRGFRYFQAFWDAPPRQMIGTQAEAGGLNFTGLGVGNRRGVGIQLAGTIVAVIGMMYAFYVKPIIKRRRKVKVLRELETLGVAKRTKPIEHTNGHAAHAHEGATDALAARRVAGATAHSSEENES